jgi:hypothetical protein
VSECVCVWVGVHIIYTHVCDCVFTHMHALIYIHIYLRIYIHTYIHTFRVYTYIHTYIYTHVTYTHSCRTYTNLHEDNGATALKDEGAQTGATQIRQGEHHVLKIVTNYVHTYTHTHTHTHTHTLISGAAPSPQNRHT